MEKYFATLMKKVLQKTVADAMDLLLKAQQEGETEFMDGEPFPESKAVVIQDEGCDYD